MKPRCLVAIAAAVLLSCGTMADGVGQSARVVTETLTIDADGTLTTTNLLGTASTTEWITAIEVSHAATVTGNVFTVTRTRDAGHVFKLETSATYTNNSLSVLYAAPAGNKLNDVFVWSNSVTGEVTKVYITKQVQ